MKFSWLLIYAIVFPLFLDISSQEKNLTSDITIKAPIQ